MDTVVYQHASVAHLNTLSGQRDLYCINKLIA